MVTGFMTNGLTKVETWSKEVMALGTERTCCSLVTLGKE